MKDSTEFLQETSNLNSSKNSSNSISNQNVNPKAMKNIGAWEKHTKGFGMKMLAKMGFRGRLGKEEDGVSMAIEVVKRPAQMGFGYGDFKEESALKTNIKIQKELKGEIDIVSNHEKEIIEDDSLWRKRKVIKNIRPHKKASEIIETEVQSVAKMNQVILDMRGPDIRVLSNVAEAYDHKRKNYSPKIGDELIYNVKMVISLAQGKIIDLKSQMISTEASIDSMQQEIKLIQIKDDQETLRILRIRAMMEKLKALNDMKDQALESLNICDMITKLNIIRSTYSKEFAAYRVESTLPAMVFPVLDQLVLGSDLLDPYVCQNIMSQFQALKDFLCAPDGIMHDNDNGENTSMDDYLHNGSGVIHEKYNAAREDLYNYILEEKLWPTVERCFKQQWDVENPAQGISLYALLQPQLSMDFDRAVKHDIIIPLLKYHCQQWNPLTATGMINEWILPWEPILEENLQSLYKDVQNTLAKSLQTWTPSDFSIFPLIKPWINIWGTEEYAKFTHRHIVPKLIRCLQRNFIIDPKNQSLKQLKWILAWKDYISTKQLVALLEGEFFPRWLLVLRNWIAGGSAKLLELEQWYCGWKKFFDEHDLTQHPRLILHFQGALLMLLTASDAHSEPNKLATLPHINPSAAKSYQEALLLAAESKSSLGDVKDIFEASNAMNSNEKKSVSHSVSLKEYIEDLAIKNDILFLPSKRMHEGQLIYTFGKHHIILGAGVVYKEDSDGLFSPIEVDNLL